MTTDPYEMEKGFLADELFAVGAIQIAGYAGAPQEGFRLKLHEKEPDAPLSPIYLNLRTPDNKDGKLTPRIVTRVAHLMKSHPEMPIGFRYMGGIPKAGEPFADELQLLFSVDSSGRWRFVEPFHFNKEVTKKGRKIGRIIEKIDPSENAEAVLIDDLVTQADTKFEAAAEAESKGLVVKAIVVLVDRQQGGAEQLRKKYNVVSVFTLSELLDYYVEKGNISLKKAHEVKAYLAANHS